MNIEYEYFLSAEYCESIESHQKDLLARKKQTFIENNKTEKSDNGNSIDITMMALLSKNKDIVKDDDIDEESKKLLSHSSGKSLPNRKRISSSHHILEKSLEKSKQCTRTDKALDDDEHYAISKIIDDIIKLPSENLIRPRITFIDFAGQSMYYAFHQIYLSRKTCYILVVDMTKRLNEEVLEPNGGKMDCSRFTSWKYQGNELVMIM